MIERALGQTGRDVKGAAWLHNVVFARLGEEEFMKY